MYKAIILLTVCGLQFGLVQAQSGQNKSQKEKKGYLYLAGGSHRIFYTPGDVRVIRRKDPAFDFTLEKVRARDEGGLKFETAPQFSYTIGYYFSKKKFGIEYQYDHIKYFAREGQTVRMKGTLNGVTYDQDTVVTDEFFRLEHSDGGNYAMINVVKWLPLSKKGKNPPELLVKGGMGIVNPKTNSRIAGHIRDDRYNLSGYVVGFELGVRVHVGKYFFATGTFKGAFANYNHFLIDGGYGKQKWFSAQFNYMIGGQFPL